MESEVSRFISIIINDPQTKNDFISCLNQYVLKGNQGRNSSKEFQIKHYLTKYKFQGSMKTFFESELFFYLLYDKSKKSLSKEYVYQILKEAKNRIFKMFFAIVE